MEHEQLQQDVRLGYELMDFKESRVGKFLFAKAVSDIKAGLSDLAEVDPTDFKKIVEIQSRVRVARNFKDWVEGGILAAIQSQEILEEQHLDDEFQHEAPQAETFTD